MLTLWVRSATAAVSRGTNLVMRCFTVTPLSFNVNLEAGLCRAKQTLLGFIMLLIISSTVPQTTVQRQIIGWEVICDP